MRRHTLVPLVAYAFVTLLSAVSAERVCYFSEEPDAFQPGRLRWVMPGSRGDRCSCTSIRPGPVCIRPGPVYTRPVPWSRPPFYTKAPIFTSDQREIQDYFDCQSMERYQHDSRPDFKNPGNSS